MLKEQKLKIGSNINNLSVTCITHDIPKETLNMLYKSVDVFANDGEYCFTNEKGLVLYSGYIDSVGLVETVVADVNEFTLMINTQMASSVGDYVTSTSLILGNPLGLAKEIYGGYQKALSNGHGKE